jgi:hypothetical protein
MSFTIAFYEIGLACGGPEEGGWWYETGEIVRLISITRTEGAALAIASRANRLLDRVQRHHRPVHSAAYDGGRFRALVFAGLPPASFPVERPAYR